MPIIDVAACQRSPLKRKRGSDDEDAETPKPNLTKCVTCVQFNVGTESPSDEMYYLRNMSGEKKHVTITVTNEHDIGNFIVIVDCDVLRDYRMSETDLSLEYISASNGNIPMPSFPWANAYEFRTPDMKLAFGDRDDFVLRYTNVFGSEKVLSITLVCAPEVEEGIGGPETVVYVKAESEDSDSGSVPATPTSDD
jgi:hypothetical protein